MSELKFSLKFLRDFKKDYSQFVSNLIANYGDAIKVKGPLYNLHFVSDPKFISHVLFDKSNHYIRPPNMVIDALLLEKESARMDEHHGWKEARTDIFNPILSETGVQNFTDIIVANTKKHLDKWEDYATNQKPLALHKTFLTLTLENFLSSIFGNVPLNLDHVSDLVRELHYLIASYEGSLSRILWVLPTSWRRRMLQTVKELHKIGDQIVKHNLSLPENNIVKQIAAFYRGPKKRNENFVA